MKIFAYSVRPYDELPAFEALQKQLGFEFAWTEEYPSPENVHLAEGADGVSIITNPTPASMLDLYRGAGVRFLSTRSIGYDHIDVAYARKLGMRVSHVTYSPNSVANYTIMLMLMACRKIGTIVESGKRQDFSLLGKMGRPATPRTLARLERPASQCPCSFSARLLLNRAEHCGSSTRIWFRPDQ